MTASVTDIRTARHSWDKQPRKDDPTRSVYTCRRDGCGLKRRSEFDGQERIQLWLWPDGGTGRGKNYPPCGSSAVTPVDDGLEPVPAPVEVSTQPQVAHPCCRCVPPLEPCGRPTHLRLGGYMCDEQAAAEAAARRGVA